MVHVTPENLLTEREACERCPRRSARKRAHIRLLGISRKVVFRIIKDIKFHPYKLQVEQQINEREKEARLA